jgi:hypothetical protein
MSRKKSADLPVSSSPAVAPQTTAPVPAKSRARGLNPKVVMHKHKQNVATEPEPVPAGVGTAVPVQQQVPVVQAPTHEEISVRAYLHAEARGFQGASLDDDWFRAERELLAERQ